MTIRLHIADGHVWARCKCAECGNVLTLGVAEAIAAPVACRCGQVMDIRSAVIEAVDRMDGAPPKRPLGGGGLA